MASRTSMSARNSVGPRSRRAAAVAIRPSVRDRARCLPDARPALGAQRPGLPRPGPGDCQTPSIHSNAAATEWTVDRIYVRIHVWEAPGTPAVPAGGQQPGAVWGSAAPGPPAPESGGRCHELDHAGTPGPAALPGGPVGARAARVGPAGPGLGRG